MPQNSKITVEGWKRLMAKFGFAELLDTHSMLTAAYNEPHRRYHTLEHIGACFRHLSSVERHADHPHEIELALWFHDVVYKIFSSTNEEDSAELAGSFLAVNAANADCIERIKHLVLITKDHSAPQTLDAKLMLDIDLSILGSPPEEYEKFEKGVREEYRRIPGFIFRPNRKKILRSFLDRSQIYYSRYFSEHLEAQARENLTRAINLL